MHWDGFRGQCRHVFHTWNEWVWLPHVIHQLELASPCSFFPEVGFPLIQTSGEMGTKLYALPQQGMMLHAFVGFE